MNDTTKKLIASIVSLVFSIFVIQSTFSQEHPSAYQFAFVVGVLSLIPSIFLFVQLIPELVKVRMIKLGKTKHLIAILLIVISLQVFEWLGFYTTSWILFVMISGIYSLTKLNMKNIPKFLLISFIYIGIIYVLFGILLKVQTPTGIFF